MWALSVVLTSDCLNKNKRADHFLLFSYDLFNFQLHVHACVCPSVSVSEVRGHQIPGFWSYRLLWYPPEVGNKVVPFARTESALDH